MENQNTAAALPSHVDSTIFQYSDGGWAAAGFKGRTGDCVTRAIAIATGRPYQEVYNEINALAGKAIARKGVPRKVYEPYLASLGWAWKPTMAIGKGCTVHARKDELPSGRLVLRLSRHIAACVDGVVRDTYDSTRGGGRCVYGYFYKAREV